MGVWNYGLTGCTLFYIIYVGINDVYGFYLQSEDRQGGISITGVDGCYRQRFVWEIILFIRCAKEIIENSKEYLDKKSIGGVINQNFKINLLKRLIVHNYNEMGREG